MSTSTTQILSALTLFIFFLFELNFSKDFKASLKKGARLRRNLQYCLASMLVLILMGQINKFIQVNFKSSVMIHPLSFYDVAGTFIFAEFINWISHYVKHKFEILWRLHFQHHYDSKYSIFLTAHTHALDVVVSGVIMSFGLKMLGHSLLAVNIYFFFYTLLNYAKHSSFELNFGPLNYLIVTNKYHKLHHQKGANINYASVLTLFDLLFGTARFPTQGENLSNLGIHAKGEPFDFWQEFVYFLKRT